MQHKTFDPCALLRSPPSSSSSSSSKRILVVLNAPIEDYDMLEQAWKACDVTICADGGANRVYDLLRNKGTSRRKGSAGKPKIKSDRESKGSNDDEDQVEMEDVKRLLPTHIHGDLDSLRPDVREFYTNLGVKVTQDPDQYSTDFGKAMKKGAEALIALSEKKAQEGAARTMTKGGKQDGQELVVEVNGPHHGDFHDDAEEKERIQDVEILILGSLAGRVDHAIGLLHEMLREQRAETSTFLKAYSSLVSSSSSSNTSPQQQSPQVQTHSRQIPRPTLTLLSPSSISFLLAPSSTNTIIHDPSQVGPTVGILPVYGPASISTKGLEWDVEDWETKMGDMVSTSNRFAEGVGECVVEVKKCGRSVGEDEEGNWVVFTVERRMGLGDSESTGKGDAMS